MDANINRTFEALRVCEDTLRFVMSNYKLANDFKNLRHQINTIINKLPINRKILIKERNIKEDKGKITITLELKRENAQDIFYANIQRTKESLRVLEEFLKLVDKKIAIKIKNIRYTVYELEKKFTLQI